MEFRPLPDVGLNARAYPWNAFIDIWSTGTLLRKQEEEEEDCCDQEYRLSDISLRRINSIRKKKERRKKKDNQTRRV